MTALQTAPSAGLPLGARRNPTVDELAEMMSNEKTATTEVDGRDAKFNEGDHPRAENGKFGNGGGGKGAGTSKEGGAAPAGAKRSLADKIKTHADTIKKHGKETADWIKQEGAANILKTVAKDHRTQAALSFALQSLVSHGTGILSHATHGAVPNIQGFDPSTWELNEKIVEHSMHHFAEVAGITALQAKATMRAGVQALLKYREHVASVSKKPIAGDAEPDGVADTLRAILDILEDDGANDEEFNESDHPRNHGKFSTSGGGGGSESTKGGEKKKTFEESKADFHKAMADYDNLAKNHEQQMNKAGINPGKLKSSIAKLGPSKGSSALDAVRNFVNYMVFLGLDEALALDRDSVREIDADGRLHVAVTNISKATVNPYRGHEIPNYEQLGLDPQKIYQLFRDPEELKKAVPTLNGVQLLRKHIPVSAEDHQPWDTVGAVMNSAEFSAPYLRNGIVVWSKDDIDAIKSGSKCELSMGYKYSPDMTPGTFEGQHYDGVMRDIVVNHVALVEDGRAGPDVVVGDSNDELAWAAIEEAIAKFA